MGTGVARGNICPGIVQFYKGAGVVQGCRCGTEIQWYRITRGEED
jgi:hypothetical protein